MTNIVRKAGRRVRHLLARIPLREEDRLEAMVGPPGVWQESRDFQIGFLRRMGLEPASSVLDIGCGVLRGGIPLIQYLQAGKYVGVDIRQEAIDEARRQVAKADLEEKRPELIRSDSFGGEELTGRTFDYVWCFQVLYHLHDELAEQCIAQIARYLHPQAVAYGNVNACGPESQWLEFPFLQRPLEFYQDLAARHGLSVEVLGELREFGYTDKVPGQYHHMLAFRRS